MNEIPQDWISVIESILFIAEKPVTVDRLKELFVDGGPQEEEIRSLLADIKTRYERPSFGFELREAQGGFQFITKAANQEYIRKYLQTKPFKLGRSALETLAIIAYRQPITRAEIDQIRGIDSSHLLRTLIERNLVQMAGKAEIPGRPVQYGTTSRFLETVGVTSIAELPPLSELDEIQGDTEDPQKKLEAGLDRFMQAAKETQEASENLENPLGEIETLINSAGRADREIYQSAVHAEVAEENKLALEGVQALKLRKRSRAVADTAETVSEDSTAEANLAAVENSIGEAGDAQPESEAAKNETTSDALPEETKDEGITWEELVTSNDPN